MVKTTVLIDSSVFLGGIIKIVEIIAVWDYWTPCNVEQRWSRDTGSQVNDEETA